MTIAETTDTGSVRAIEARPAGFVADTSAIAGRALRAIPRDVEAVIPPIFIALFFFLVNIATLSDITETQIEGFNFTSFQLPTAILLGVTACRGRRHSCSTCRTATSTACCSPPSGAWRSCSGTWLPTSPSPAR